MKRGKRRLPYFKNKPYLKILGSLAASPKIAQKIADDTGKGQSVVIRQLQPLARDGAVIRGKHKTYALTMKGLKILNLGKEYDRWLKQRNKPGWSKRYQKLLEA